MLDDDARTRRVERLMFLVTVWLVMIVSAIVAVSVLVLNGPGWVSAGVGGVGAASILAAWLRRRLGLSARDAAAAPDAPVLDGEQAANVVPIKKGGTE